MNKISNRQSLAYSECSGMLLTLAGPLRSSTWNECCANDRQPCDSKQRNKHRVYDGHFRIEFVLGEDLSATDSNHGGPVIPIAQFCSSKNWNCSSHSIHQREPNRTRSTPGHANSACTCLLLGECQTENNCSTMLHGTCQMTRDETAQNVN